VQSVNSEPVIERLDDRVLDEAQVAAVAFLARYNGRTSTPTGRTCAVSSVGLALSASRF
jgi:hypothetical protein